MIKKLWKSSRAIVKYRAHPNAIGIKKNCTKATQNSDISTKLVKDNADIFAELFLPASISALKSLFSHRN